MFKKFCKAIKETIVEEYKFIILLLALYIVFTWPVNYYIVIGGGISDIDSRIEIVDGYDSKGSFNISYVTELEGRVATYLLSYVMPDWKRVNMDDYKYDESENIEDIEFRSDLDLKSANSTAVKLAYQLAGKQYKETNVQIYITSILENFDTNLQIQDQLLSINDQSFSSVEEYRTYLQTFNNGEEVSVKVLRNGKEKVVTSKLSKLQDRIVLGVTLEKVSDYEVKPDINIQFRPEESGPSGGLITTLDIYDKLTEEDLTHGLKIAGTGTIDEEGNVGEIGEVKYKLLGAVSEDADVFLVPKGENYKTCMKVQKEKDLKIQIIGVATLEEAIDALEALES